MSGEYRDAGRTDLGAETRNAPTSVAGREGPLPVPGIPAPVGASPNDRPAGATTQAALPPIPEGHPHAEALDDIATRYELRRHWADRALHAEVREEQARKADSLRASYAALLASPSVVADAPDPLADLIARFSAAMLDKLRAEDAAGRTGWDDPDRLFEWRRRLVSNAAEGETLDAAAYAAFLWHAREARDGRA